MSLFDLITAICFMTPIMIGFGEGKQIGFWAGVIGVSLGLILGVASAVGYRFSLWYFYKWMQPYAENPPNVRTICG